MQNAEFIERNACISCGENHITVLSEGKFNEGPLKRFIEEDPWGSEHPAPFLLQKEWSFVRCETCGMSFHRYILSPEWSERKFSKWMSQEAIDAFEKSYKTPDTIFQKGRYNAAHVLQIESLTRDIRNGSTTRILDFGCGYGEFLSMCAAFGFDAYGVDRATARLDGSAYEKVFAEIGDVAHIAPFHALSLFEVLEHLDDPKSLVVELRNLIIPGGILVLEVPDCTGVTNITSRYDYYKIHPLEHINGFTPSTLKDFVNRLGFESIDKQLACVTDDSKIIAKNIVKRLVKPLLKPTTQMYFRKTQ